VKRVIQKLDVIRPRISWIFVQPMHITLKSTVSEKTQGSRDLDRIVETPSGNIRLAYGSDAGPGPAGKLPFHRRKRGRLVTRDHLCLLVATRKGDKQRSKQPNQCSRSKIERSLSAMDSAQSVKGSHTSHDKRAGHQRGRLVVDKLNEGPG